MGRSYCFECSKCAYRATVSGRFDRGLNFAVQTISCRDCKRLYEAVTRLRIPDELKERSLSFGLRGTGLATQKAASSPPSFESLLNRLPYKGVKHFRWLRFKPQCPVSAYHQV